jgi:hypothetical protein
VTRLDFLRHLRTVYETYFELRCRGDDEAEAYLDMALKAERIIFRRLPIHQVQEDSDRLKRRIRADHARNCGRLPCVLVATQA